jgi:uncharacterized protein YuzE
MEKKLSYDPEQDILHFNRGEIVQDSLEIGNMYIEFSGDGKVVGIEVTEASKFISDFTGEEFSSEALENVSDAELKIMQSGEFMIITLHFIAEKEGREVRDSIGVNIPAQAVSA